MKFTKTHEVPHNSAEILLNTCQFNIFETYLGMCFAINLQIYLETLSLKRENVPVPGVLRLLLRKTGHWPPHDMKIFAIGSCTFLSSLLLEEQMMISDKKKTVGENTKSKRDHKTSGGFELKIARFKKATFISSQCFCCCCYCTG